LTIASGFSTNSGLYVTKGKLFLIPNFQSKTDSASGLCCRPVGIDVADRSVQ
jgi:hypothetical protein